jgi:putative transposase
MARKPRLHIPGGLYHVMLRGNGGQPIFFREEDRVYFAALVEEGVARFGHRIHAYCWMDNHVHLAVQVGEIPLARIMQNVAFRYTRWINRREARLGHLFQGRYKAILVDVDSYLLELVRYIHLNPVRAGFVEEPACYPWSGHCAYLGQVSIGWLTTDWVLSQFAPHSKTARTRYVQFVREGIGEARRGEFHGGSSEGRLLGDEAFIERVLRQANQPVPKSIAVEDIVKCVCYHLEVEANRLASRERRRCLSEARAWIGLLAVESQAVPLTILAHQFKREVATLSNAVRRLRERIARKAPLAERLMQMQQELMQKTKA